MITTTRGFSLSIRTTLPFAQCLDLLRRSLREAGLHIVTEIPFHDEFKRHVGMPWQNYTVLVVWSPFVAYQALRSDSHAGVFMPFNFVVAEDEEFTLIATTDHFVSSRAMGTLGMLGLSRGLTRKISEIFSKFSAEEKFATDVCA
jgi:uncharacterized protein (DUF302 family)